MLLRARVGGRLGAGGAFDVVDDFIDQLLLERCTIGRADVCRETDTPLDFGAGEHVALVVLRSRPSDRVIIIDPTGKLLTE